MTARTALLASAALSAGALKIAPDKVGQAFADEEGGKNLEVSDADRKMDALMDMIKDACSKMDAVGGRMDAMEEQFKADSERRDSERRDAAKKDDEDGDGEDKTDPKEPPFADKRKDSDDEEAEAKAEKDRRDAEEAEEAKAEKDRKDAAKRDEDDDRSDAMADAMRGEMASLRAEIAKLQGRVPAIISDNDRERFAVIQEQADPVFQAFGDRAPGPLDGETPTSYKRRLGAKMQSHSPKWKDTRLTAIADEAALDVVVNDVYADAMVAARAGVDVPAGQLRMITRQSGGHTINEFEGGSDAWMNSFAGNSQRATGDWRRPH